MKSHSLGLFALVIAGLVLGTGNASAYPEGSSPTVDPANLVIYPTVLVGLGDTLPTFDSTDVAIAGISDTEVGIDAASADTLADPPPGTLVVDDDQAPFPNATYTSINAAILAAMPGDTIKVCPGDYKETVLVDKPVALRG